MNAELRAQVGRADGISGFCHAQPFDNALFNEALAGVDGCLATIRAKQGEWLAGVGTEHTSTASLTHFRDWIRMQFQKLVRVAVAIGRKEPGFEEAFRLSKDHTADLKVVAELRAMLAIGEARAADFERYALLPTFYSSMRQELDRFEEILAERKAGKSGHVGARAVLDDVDTDLKGHIDDLDAINTVRFAANPELMAAWKSASRMPSRRKARSEAAKAARKARAAEARAAQG